MRKFNTANAYVSLRPELLRRMFGLKIVCVFPGLKA